MMDRRKAKDDFIIDNDECEMDEDISDEGTSEDYQCYLFMNLIQGI